MSMSLGTLAISANTPANFDAPNSGVKAILIGCESGLTVTITMESGGVQKTLYPGTVDWFDVRKGFTGNIKISPVAILNNTSTFPASVLSFDAVGLNDSEQASMYPMALPSRSTNIGNGVTITGGTITIASGSVTVSSGSISVSGVSGTVNIAGAVTVTSGSIAVSGVSGTVTITGAVTVSNSLTIGSVSTTVQVASTGANVVNIGTVVGTVTVAGSVTISSGTVNIGTVAGTVTIAGAVTISSGSLNIGTITGPVTIGTGNAVIGHTSGIINAGNPIFSATVGFGTTIDQRQHLNIFNPSSSGKTYTFYSIRAFTSSSNVGTIAFLVWVAAPDLNLATSVAAVSHAPSSSPPVSTAHCTSNETVTPLGGTTLEGFDTQTGVTEDFLSFPDIVTLAPGGNLYVELVDFVDAGHAVRLTMKWSEA